jgi:Cys-tRNA(Pro)/Cys-tRNA(Cys) deacylase
MNIHKTNAARILDQLHLPYELIPYEVDEADLSAVHVASTLGEPVERVFKTILLRGDKKGFLVTVIPGDCEVNLKAVAPISGNKKVEPVTVKELLPLMGYIRGGCSPIGMKKPYPVFLHESALQYNFIYVSAGIRGLQLKLSPADLVKSVSATIALLV